ncbi:MAG TPA: type I methionyl aminopeptidase [Longimicrobiales bacterium]|nr:type I methionyl aminopeptidase [Longimicrobiales bacterium]
MIALRNAQEIRAIEEAGQILGRMFRELEPRVVPGVTTAELDAFGEEFIRSHTGAVPAFKGLYGFPASLCISVNEEVVHGIPSTERRLNEGDIVSLDGGVKLNGWFADAARTFPVGAVDERTAELLAVTRASLEAGIEQARAGNRLGDVGYAIQQVAEAAGFGVVRDLVGHGIGREPHEEPQVPNFGRPGRGLRLQAGLVIAIEPMVNAGEIGVRTLEDRWTVVAADGSRSAHFEQTVAVTEAGPLVLTA